MQHRRTTVTFLAAGLLLTSIMQPPAFTNQNDGIREALNETNETPTAFDDRDILLINGNAFDLT